MTSRCWWFPLLLAATALGQTVTVTAIQNGASFTSRITPGGFATIEGTNFTSATQSATTLPVPDTLGGVSVTIAGLPCPIYYVSPTQINFLVPWKTSIGSYPLIVTANGQTVGPTNITITSEAPGIFEYGENRAVAQNLNTNYTLNGPSAPAATGSTLVVYVNGIGMVSNPPSDGAASPSNPLSQASYISSATIGGVNAPITFLGLTPGFVGLAQANITVPSLPSGDYPLILTVAGLESTSALVSVEGTGTAFPLVLSTLATIATPTTPTSAPIQGPAHSSGTVAISGSTAYVCDANGIAIVSVATAATPKVLSNFGEYDLNGAGSQCEVSQGNLLAFTTGFLIVYNIGAPTAPQRIGMNQFYYGSKFLENNTAYVWTQIDNEDPATFNITSETGDFYLYDLTAPTSPKLDALLVQNTIQPGIATNSPQLGVAAFNNQTVIALGTTATAYNTPGQAIWTTINVANPSSPAFLAPTPLPGASIAVNLALQGNLALVASNTGAPLYPPPGTAYAYSGKLTLSAVDFTNPTSGNILSTLVTPYQATSGYAMISLGSGFFAITFGPPLTDLKGPTTLAIVDARNTANLAVYPEYAIDGLQGITFSNGNLYAISNAGLTVFSVTLP